jgi:hypothetical protein
LASFAFEVGVATIGVEAGRPFSNFLSNVIPMLAYDKYGVFYGDAAIGIATLGVVIQHRALWHLEFFLS